MAGKLLLIVNPCAGQRKATKCLAELIRLFSDYDWDTTVYVTGKRGDARDYLLNRVNEFDRIVCAGGDGTLNEAFSGMLMSAADKPIAYLPAGTTNDYANSLGFSKDMLQAGKDAMLGVERRMDVGRINGKYFAYTASFGAFTKTAYNTPQNIKNALGHTAYLLEGLKELPQIKPIHMKINADGREIEDDFLFGAINNSITVGGVLKLNSALVDMSDGEFEVLLLRNPQNVTQLNEMVLSIVRSDFSGSMCYFFKAKKLKIQCPPDLSWTRDGEFEIGGGEVEIENMCRAIRLIVPENAAESGEAQP